MAGLPLVLALYYQRGLGYTALQSALGVTAYAVGQRDLRTPDRPRGHPDRPAARRRRRGHLRRGCGALAVVAAHVPDGHATLALAAPLFVMGCGQGVVITPNQTLALMDVDPLMGSTAGGVLQTGQRIGLADRAGPDRCGLLQLADRDSAATYARALGNAVIAAICFVSIAVAIGVHDLVRARRRESLV